MKKMFANILIELAKQDKDIVLIVGDLGYGMIEDFRKQFPNRFFNCGCREQAMVGMAAGMALMGLKPYVYTATPFLIERAFEQIKIDIDAMKTNVKLIGFGDYPGQGLTHKALNPKKLMGFFNNVKSYFPKTETELAENMSESYIEKTPAFIELRRLK